MKRMWYVLIISVFLASMISLNVNLSFQKSSEGDSTLALENIEALGSPEAGVGFKQEDIVLRMELKFTVYQ